MGKVSTYKLLRQFAAYEEMNIINPCSFEHESCD